MDDDDVSVADLLIREGWDDHEESRAKSRWRVIAVTIGVVVACGAAAVLVGFDSEPEQNAQPNQVSVIEMPKRPSENRGAGATSAAPSTETVETGEGSDGGTSSQPSKTTSSRRTSSSAAPTSDSPDPTTPTSSKGPADPPRTTGSTGAPQQPNPTPPTSTTTPAEECNLWPKWLWC
ncbi:serine/threonine protein kinase [Amycolatopsis coloradensis]|uniref:Serine/threonine protein kinase n=1 Tax=Amycolatopsis coloradensis TaxID=76021 RepID=A0A1R0KM51_9PSEU|nr:serine/threonine protein kinase [Amycolatopsis coloradensis]OLZ47699.1 serine/threonine protein kinase [Amycolatopsis coloradensis]